MCVKVSIVPDNRVEQFNELIKTLPDEVTREDEELVKSLRALYDEIPSVQKELIPKENVKKLEEAEKKINALKAENQAKADAVALLIDQLPEVENIKPDDKAAVDVVWNRYEELTDEQKALVPKDKREKLEALVKALEAENDELAERFTAAVNAVPGNKAGEGKGLVDKATAIKAEMTEAQLALVKPETFALYEEELEAFRKGRIFKSGSAYYRVLSNGDLTYLKPADKSLTNVLIPNQVKKGKFFFKVIRVSNNAFRNCKKLHWIVVSKNIYVFGEYAFSRTPSLTRVRIMGTGFKSGKINSAFLRAGKNNKLRLTVPRSKKNEYEKLFRGEGQLSDKSTVMAA